MDDAFISELAVCASWTLDWSVLHPSLRRSVLSEYASALLDEYEVPCARRGPAMVAVEEQLRRPRDIIGELPTAVAAAAMEAEAESAGGTRAPNAPHRLRAVATRCDAWRFDTCPSCGSSGALSPDAREPISPVVYDTTGMSKTKVQAMVCGICKATVLPSFYRFRTTEHVFVVSVEGTKLYGFGGPQLFMLTPRSGFTHQFMVTALVQRYVSFVAWLLGILTLVHSAICHVPVDKHARIFNMLNSTGSRALSSDVLGRALTTYGFLWFLADCANVCFRPAVARILRELAPEGDMEASRVGLPRDADEVQDRFSAISPLLFEALGVLWGDHTCDTPQCMDGERAAPPVLRVLSLSRSVQFSSWMATPRSGGASARTQPTSGGSFQASAQSTSLARAYRRRGRASAAHMRLALLRAPLGAAGAQGLRRRHRLAL